MNRDEIIRIAREQGLPETAVEGVFRVNADDLGRMLAAEREACAKVCDELASPSRPLRDPARSWIAGTLDCAAAIRARGEKGDV